MNFHIFTCICLLVSFSLLPAGESAVVCPPLTSYAPCNCREYTPSQFRPQKPGKITLNCQYFVLSDSRVSQILDTFLTTPGVSALVELELTGNQLSKVPDQIVLFPELTDVFLSQNEIASIGPSSFIFNETYPLSLLTLGQNDGLSTIAPGAFQGNGYVRDSEIVLDNCNLTRFEATVFQSLLEKLTAVTIQVNSYVNIVNNPINCDCHLAWLIRDNRQLLSAVVGGECSDGTTFEQLRPRDFINCPSFVCPLGYDGYYADPASCSSYYNCTENVANQLDCPLGLVFNEITSQCDQPANVPNCQ